jgi:isocitrate dehydrogenase
LKCFYEVAKDYPEIEVNDLIVDDLAMKLVVRPQDFDVVVLPNLQGDIISDLCAGLVGGLGFAPSANIGDYISIFEAVHGTAPDIAGKGLANPTALLMSGIMMLRHLGHTKEAALIENALLFSVEIGARTIDFGNISKPALGTLEFAQFISKQLGKEPSATKPTIAIPATAFSRPDRDLSKNRMMVSNQMESAELIGADIFVESTAQASEIAEIFKPFIGDAFQITTMSNRGTQVYPVGSVYTDCINQYRVRLESVEEKVVTPDTIFQLCIQLSKAIRICSTEMLMKYGGVKAYSLAQGQS